ncbi:MAG: hypothetical protein IKD50_01760 [Clostridia bacterium]|nr:hypothetical protein [Clostridia bacterium]
MKIMIYDVETANNKDIGSICAIGWMLLCDDKEIDSGYSLINPKCSFTKYNTDVHGITANDVENAPTFCEYWNDVLSTKMPDSIILAHGADFDMSATEQALYSAGIEDPGLFYVDTIAILQGLFTSESFKLSYLANVIGYEYQAHNALEDVKALYYVLLVAMKSMHFDDFATMIIKSGVGCKNTMSNNYIPHKIDLPKSIHTPYSRCKEDVDIIDDSLSGKRICITGYIDGYDLASIERLIKQHSGRMTTSVSSKTDYLVVGKYDDIYGPGYVSTKQKTALTLIESGSTLQILTPAEFFDLIGMTSES